MLTYYLWLCAHITTPVTRNIWYQLNTLSYIKVM